MKIAGLIEVKNYIKSDLDRFTEIITSSEYAPGLKRISLYSEIFGINNMIKVNFGLALLVLVIILISFFYKEVNKNFVTINEQLEIINSKLDHIEYDLHELEEK